MLTVDQLREVLKGLPGDIPVGVIAHGRLSSVKHASVLRYVNDTDKEPNLVFTPMGEHINDSIFIDCTKGDLNDWKNRDNED